MPGIGSGRMPGIGEVELVAERKIIGGETGRIRVVVISLIMGGALSFLGAHPLQTRADSPSPGSGWIRVNQVGYRLGEPKAATLMGDSPVTSGRFRVVNAATGAVVFRGPVGAARGFWSAAYPFTYTLDFSALETPGRYYLDMGDSLRAVSPTFPIESGANLYEPLLANALFFYQAQHDGREVDPSVMDRQPSHLSDEEALVYETPAMRHGAPVGPLTRVGGPVDASGGWFDAGDYLKFVETASYVDDVLLFSVRRYPGLLTAPGSDFADEARYGLDWLDRMWDSDTQTLYYQVGIADGNDRSIQGDHDSWRLPETDDRLAVSPGDPAYYVRFRPVFRAGPPGAPVSPNLAGRMAAAFALGFQVYRESDPAYAEQCLRNAVSIYDLAKTTNIGKLLTTAPHDCYPEVSWRDDMELGAVEIYKALSKSDLQLDHPASYYLRQAAHWAQEYMLSPNDGTDSLNLYDVSGLAHYELYRAMAGSADSGDLEVTRRDLLNDLNDQLSRGIQQAQTDPFGLGVAYGSGDATPHALGYAVEAALYDELAGAPEFAAFGRQERNWALGENAWGTSFIVGAGTTFPVHLHHQIANLAGSLDGTGAILLGATVDGPASPADCANLSGLETGMKTGPDTGDRFAQFNGHGARYRDYVSVWPCVEPADDYTALSVLLFAQQAG